MNASVVRALAPLAVVGALVLTGAPPASAAEHNVYPGCAFSVRLDVEPLDRTEKELPSRNGLTRSIIAGKGYVLTFTNVDAPENVITVRTGGSVQHITYNADRTVQTVKGTGHNVVLLFPDDDSEVPGVPVPSTNLYKGRVDYTYVLATGFTTVLDVRGQVVDICAELA